MSLISSNTDLKSLKYVLTGARRDPSIVKPIPDSRTNLGIGSSLQLQVSKRADDALRMTKLMGRPEGLRFIRNQALLNQSALTSAINRGQRPSIRQTGRDAARSLGVSASAIAQAGVSGTGLRFVQGFTPSNGGYLPSSPIAKGSIALRGNPINDSSVRSEYSGFTGRDEGTKAGLEEVEKAKAVHTDPPNIYLGQRKGGTQPSGLLSDSSFESRYEGFTGLNEEGKAGLDQVEDAKQVGEENKEISKRSLIKDIGEGEKVQYININDVVEDTPLENRFFTLKSNGKKLEEDKINILEVRSEEIDNTSEQIIPFLFKTYPGSNNPEFLYFRAYLESLGDNYSGNWTSTNYIGRADPIFTYDSFSRGVNFSFKIATFSKADLKPLYDKLNRLVSTTAPHYEDNGFFKQGVFVAVTIGDYVKKVPGFFQSIDVNWDINYPWEVEESGRKVPHILDVNCSFQPIHNFNPQYGDGFNFIGPVEDLELTESSDRDVEPETLTDPESTIGAQSTRFLQPV